MLPLALGLGCSPAEDAGARKASDAVTKAPQPTAPAPLQITLRSIDAEFRANRMAAERRYLGQPVRVVAKIQLVARNSAGTAYLQLVEERDPTRQPPLIVYAFFDSTQEAGIFSLAAGQQVAILCAQVRPLRADGFFLSECRVAAP